MPYDQRLEDNKKTFYNIDAVTSVASIHFRKILFPALSRFIYSRVKVGSIKMLFTPTLQTNSS